MESGVIEDPNYELDESGKVHYKVKTRKNESSRAVHPGKHETSFTFVVFLIFLFSDEQHSSTKKRKKIGNSSSDSESDDDYKPSYTVLRQQQTEGCFTCSGLSLLIIVQKMCCSNTTAILYLDLLTQ